MDRFSSFFFLPNTFDFRQHKYGSDVHTITEWIEKTTMEFQRLSKNEVQVHGWICFPLDGLLLGAGSHLHFDPHKFTKAPSRPWRSCGDALITA